ncbi:MAG: PVC-type heme-binding CxxCH protein [Flavobacteriaceae bacterium]
MNANRSYFGAFLLGILFYVTGCDQKESVDLSSFQIHPDFTLELAASEPLVFDPVEMEFDENGKAYVIEMPSYPNPSEQNRIIILYDNDKDGLFDERKIYAENLGVASSLLPYKEGLLVAAPPELLFLKDTDGDDVADQREVLMSGFAYGNTQHNFNGLTYGLDNWIYGANGGNSGVPYWADSPENKFSIGQDDFRINLITKKIERIGDSSGGFELAFDHWGNIFETHNLEHISHLAFNERYLDKIPELAHIASANISDHDIDGLARIYPIGAQETRVNHPEQSGFFSGACGVTFYGGGNWGPEFENNVFVADVVLNLIHRDVISPQGSSFTASRGRENVAFLASTDRAFRPVNMTVGPDGSLYVLDMHREVIEHPEWIPDEIEANLDLNAGKDKGRIYRISPKQFKGHNSNKIGRADTRNLVNLMEHPSQWHRVTAQRVLVETQDKAAIPLLTDLISKTNNPLAKMHALYSLQGLEALNTEILLLALNDPNAELRRHVIILCENYVDVPEIRDVILQAATDGDIRVRRQAALSLSIIDSIDKTFLTNKQRALYQILQRDLEDSWSGLAVLSASTEQPIKLLNRLLEDQGNAGSEKITSQLATLVAIHNPEATSPLINRLASMKTPNRVRNLLAGLLKGFDYRNFKLGESEKRGIASRLNQLEKQSELPTLALSWKVRNVLSLAPAPNRQVVLQSASGTLKDSSKPVEDRLNALGLLATEDFSGKMELFLQLLDPKEPSSIQVAVIETISRSVEQGIAEKLIAMWPGLSPAVRLKVSDFLIYNPQNQATLLTAIEGGHLKLGELNLHLERRRELLFSDDKSVRDRAEKLFTDAGVVTRKGAIESFRPALEMQGEKGRGAEIYEALCAQCHQKSGTGIAVGPNLSEIYRKSAETLLYDIVDPNAGADAVYINHIIKTKEGEIFSGIIASETEANVSLLNIGGTAKTIPRGDIVSFESTGQSLMPEGLESTLDPQKMADLLAYLQTMD